jgi:hypothetical protein
MPRLRPREWNAAKIGAKTAKNAAKIGAKTAKNAAKIGAMRGAA